MSKLYRKSSLDKLSSPEQLDKMIKITSPMFWIGVLGGGVILIAALLWSIFTRLPINIQTKGIFISKGGIQTVYSENSGIVKEILVSGGDKVEENTVIARFDTGRAGAGNEDAEIRSSVMGYVVDLDIVVGSSVQAGDPVCTLSRTGSISGSENGIDRAEGGKTEKAEEPIRTKDEVICYVPISEGKKISEGMDAMIYPTTVSRQEYGHLSGTVREVADYVTSMEDVKNRLGDSSLVQAFSGSFPVIMVRIELEEDRGTASGYKWSNKNGSEVTIAPLTMVDADIVIDEKAPITMLIPLVKEKMSVQREKDNNE